jgi:hypothetical protein
VLNTTIAADLENIVWEAIKDFLNDLVENIPALLVVSGLILFLLGAAGGISYWFIVQDNIGRTIMVSGGILFIIIGILMRRAIPVAGLEFAKYGLKITYPEAGDELDRHVNIRGTFKKRPPEGYDVRLLRLYPKSGAYYPMGHASFSSSEKTWEAPECDLGGDSRDNRIIGLYLVGPSGKILLEYFKLAEGAHRDTRNELEKLGGKAIGFLPLLSKEMKTRDMLECHSVRIVRK